MSVNQENAKFALIASLSLITIGIVCFAASVAFLSTTARFIACLIACLMIGVGTGRFAAIRFQ